MIGSKLIFPGCNCFACEGPSCLFLQTHLMSSKVPLHCQMGLAEALAWHQSARTRLCLKSSPIAERAISKLPRSTSSLSTEGLGPLPSQVLSAYFLSTAPPRTCRHFSWLPNPLRLPSGRQSSPSCTGSPHWPHIPGTARGG